MVKEETADIQVRVSKRTLEAIEKHGTYEDKNTEGILKRILPEYEQLKKTCPVAATPKEAEKKPEEIKEEPPKKEEVAEKPETKSEDKD